MKKVLTIILALILFAGITQATDYSNLHKYSEANAWSYIIYNGVTFDTAVSSQAVTKNMSVQEVINLIAQNGFYVNPASTLSLGTTLTVNSITTESINESGTGVIVESYTTFNDGNISLTGGTGVNEFILTTNLADALSFEDSAGDLIVFCTTTGSQKITFTPQTIHSSIECNGTLTLANDETIANGTNGVITLTMDAVYPDAKADDLGSGTYEWDVYVATLTGDNGETLDNNTDGSWTFTCDSVLPDTSGDDFGSTSKRWELFGTAITSSGTATLNSVTTESINESGTGVIIEGCTFNDGTITLGNGTTGTNSLILTTNLADAWSINDGSDLVVFKTTTGSQSITFTPLSVFSNGIEVNGTYTGAQDETFNNATDGYWKFSACTITSTDSVTSLILGEVGNEITAIYSKAFYGQNSELIDNSNDGYWNFSASTIRPDSTATTVHLGATGYEFADIYVDYVKSELTIDSGDATYLTLGTDDYVGIKFNYKNLKDWYFAPNHRDLEDAGDDEILEISNIDGDKYLYINNNSIALSDTTDDTDVAVIAQWTNAETGFGDALVLYSNSTGKVVVPDDFEIYTDDWASQTFALDNATGNITTYGDIVPNTNGGTITLGNTTYPFQEGWITALKVDHIAEEEANHDVQIDNQLELNKGFVVPVISVVANYTVNATDDFIIVGSSTVEFSVTLPEAPETGAIFYVENKNTGDIDIITTGSTKIEGADSIGLTTQYTSYEFVFDGTEYITIGESDK